MAQEQDDNVSVSGQACREQRGPPDVALPVDVGARRNGLGAHVLPPQVRARLEHLHRPAFRCGGGALALAAILALALAFAEANHRADAHLAALLQHLRARLRADAAPTPPPLGLRVWERCAAPRVLRQHGVAGRVAGRARALRACVPHGPMAQQIKGCFPAVSRPRTGGAGECPVFFCRSLLRDPLRAR